MSAIRRRFSSSAAVGCECEAPGADEERPTARHNLVRRILSSKPESPRPSRNFSSSSSSPASFRSPSGVIACLYLTLALFLVVDLFFATPSLLAAAAKSKKKKSADESAVKTKCTVCRSLVKKFLEGLEKTKKSGYGGGNTAWEERSLGKNSFAKSETRFVEIMERVCDDVSGETEKFYCGNIVENHEEDIEDWYQSDQESEHLEESLCVKALEVCCPYGSWGPDCSPCTDGVSVFCNGRGDCKGNGTRVGNGQCDCQWPYKGKSCTQCQSGYFIDETHSNATHMKCVKCDGACGGDGCKGPQASDCVNCATGYETTPDAPEDKDPKGCVDIDECANSPCSKAEYCTNSIGSYSCHKCDKICDPESGCLGGEPSDCVECRSGAAWDADRKNCIVTDWAKYDEAIEADKKKEKEEEEGEEEENDEDKKLDEMESDELNKILGGGENDDDNPFKDVGAQRGKKLDEMHLKLDELKKKLGGEVNEKKNVDDKVKAKAPKTLKEKNEQSWRDETEEPTDALFDEPVIDDHMPHDEL